MKLSQISILLFIMIGLLTASPATATTGPESAVKDSESRQQAANRKEQEKEQDQEKDIPPLHHEVTVVATRTPTSSRELGRAVSVITADEISAQGARTVAQVLETIPGMSVVQAGSFGSQTSLFVRGGESNFNLVMIDGVPVNRAGGEFDFSSLTTANIERIEIIRGPASVLYGADAAGATIHIITRKGESSFSGDLAFEAGNYHTRQFHGNLSGSSQKADYSFGFLTSDTDGIYDFNSSNSRTEYSARGGFALTEESRLEASLRFSDGKQQFPTDSTGAPVDPNDFRKGQEEVYSVLYRNQVNADYFSQVQYGYHRHQSKTFTLFDGISDFYSDTFRQDENRHFVDWQNSLNLGPAHLLTAGLSFRRESSATENFHRRSVGIYVQDQFELGPRTFLTAGIRWDDNNSFSNFTTGNADFSFWASDSFKLRASIGNGFRAPDFSEILGFPLWGITGNPNLKPEKNTAFDAGVDFFSPSGKTRISGTFFYSRFSDLIEFTFLAAPGSPNYQNIEKARSRGIELEMSRMINRLILAGGNYTYTSTRVLDSGDIPGGGFETGTKLLRRPAHMALIFTRFSHRRFDLRFDFKYKGDREDLQFFPDFSSRRVLLSGYWKVDFGATVPIIRFAEEKGVLSAVIRGDNLFNKDYEEIAGFRSPGRLVQAGLEIRY